MPFIPTPNVAMATLFYQDVNGILAVNRLYCGCTGAPTMIDLEEITNALYDVWNAQMLDNMQNNWSLTGITARAMNEAEGLQYVDENAYPLDGNEVAATANPSQVCYTVTLNTGLVGRSARGRVYGVGLPVTFQNATRLTDAAQTQLQASWTLIQTAMETAGHAIQIVSFTDGGVPRTEGRSLPLVSLNVRFPLATQRRRLS